MPKSLFFSSHHIFGIQPDKTIAEYCYNTEPTMLFGKANLNIWQLKKIFTLFGLYLKFWGRQKPQKTARKELLLVWSLLETLDKKASYQRNDIQTVAIILLQLGPSYFLNKLQQHLGDFGSALTPQYRDVIELMDFTIHPRNELIFHACNPDIYVWTPPKNTPTEKMIVVFLTRSNTLNMPRPLAHFILSRLGVSIMYIANRPNMKPNEFLIGHDLKQTAALITKIAKHLNIQKLYGLGTSYGGFKACQLASLVNFERVLNFSGARNEDDKAKDLPPTIMAPDYDHNKIMSVLSASDPIDQKIVEAYDRDGFVTTRSWLKTKSHGSFSAAFIEGKLDAHLSWLLNPEVVVKNQQID